MIHCIMIPQLEQLEARNKQIQIRSLEVDSVLHPTKLELTALIYEQIDILDKLRIHYPHLYKFPQKSIFDAIISDYKRKGMSPTGLNMIYDICKYTQFNKYKWLIYEKKKPELKNDYEAQGEKHVIDSQTLDNIHFMETNWHNPTIQNFIQRKMKEQHKEEIASKRQILEQQKITVPRPPWLEGKQGRDSMLYFALLDLEKIIHDCAIRVWQYPPELENDDKWYAQGIKTLAALFTPGADLKYVRDILSYLDISYEKHVQSIHSAMSKSKIRTATGRLRKLTREQIADIDPRLILLAIHILELVPGIIEFCLYLLKDQKPFIADFHLDRHDKLSEGAFGSGSYA